MRITLLFLVGLCVTFLSVLYTVLAVFDGFLAGGGGIFGAVLAPVILVVFGIVLMTLGMRRKRYSKRR
ncbi:MAG: hypothetical protein ABSA72_12455 [Nitrososphaerales archaeon]|jgi:hypothetical protein